MRKTRPQSDEERENEIRGAKQTLHLLSDVLQGFYANPLDHYWNYSNWTGAWFGFGFDARLRLLSLLSSQSFWLCDSAYQYFYGAGSYKYALLWRT